MQKISKNGLQRAVISLSSFVRWIHAKNDLKAFFKFKKGGPLIRLVLSIWCHFIRDLKNFQDFNLWAHSDALFVQLCWLIIFCFFVFFILKGRLKFDSQWRSFYPYTQIILEKHSELHLFWINTRENSATKYLYKSY